MIILRPDSPSFFSASSVGTTDVISCTMIEAEMYGMMPRAKIAIRPTAPPANILKSPSTPWLCCWKACASASGLMPGSGI
ncbi:hypothetical protein D3C80_2070100 [compost metagenome]